MADIKNRILNIRIKALEKLLARLAEQRAALKEQDAELARREAEAKERLAQEVREERERRTISAGRFLFPYLEELFDQAPTRAELKKVAEFLRQNRENPELAARDETDAPEEEALAD